MVVSGIDPWSRAANGLSQFGASGQLGDYPAPALTLAARRSGLAHCPPGVVVALVEAEATLSAGYPDSWQRFHALSATRLSTGVAQYDDYVMLSALDACRPSSTQQLSGLLSAIIESETGSSKGRGLSASEPIACLVLPMTGLGSESRFIRSLQGFEVTFTWMAGCLTRSRAALSAGNAEAAALELHAARDPARWCAPLWRLCARVDPREFAAIRKATSGTSALGSRGWLDLLSGLDRLGEELTSGSDATPSDVRREFAWVDAWATRWSRIHRSLAHRLIGDLPGTGGTDGVAYLDRRMAHLWKVSGPPAVPPQAHAQ